MSCNVARGRTIAICDLQFDNLQREAVARLFAVDCESQIGTVTSDVAVVGAGPAGAWTACLLARRGARVLLFDHSHPREKPCGGGITGTGAGARGGRGRPPDSCWRSRSARPGSPRPRPRPLPTSHSHDQGAGGRRPHRVRRRPLRGGPSRRGGESAGARDEGSALAGGFEIDTTAGPRRAARDRRRGRRQQPGPADARVGRSAAISSPSPPASSRTESPAARS